MPPWIKIEGDINSRYQPTLVRLSEEATRLSEANAQQVTRSASDEYPAYRWKAVTIMGFPDSFVVEGTPKPGKKSGGTKSGR
jgi:hypothetical protein